MKTLKHIYKVFSVFVLLIGCSDNSDIDEVQTAQENGFDKSLSIEDQIMAIPNNSFADKAQITAYAEVLKEVLSMAEDSDFRNYIYENAQALSASGDDYIVYLDKAAKTFEGTRKFGKSVSNIESLTTKIQEFDKEARPMVFFPKAETIEDNAKASKGYEVAKNLNRPIGVIKGAYNNDYSAPGYKLNARGQLVFERMVTEEYAWENDVYVIGEAENLPPVTNYILPDGGSGGGGIGGGSSSGNIREDGRREYGGRIKVTDINAIEHWFSGKLEMQIVVAGLKGSVGTVIKNEKFPRIKRKHFKDEKWYDYNSFLFYWNKSNLGEYNIEKWIERDGGSDSEFTWSVPGTAATSTSSAQPGYSVKVKTDEKIDDLGENIVQFSDPLDTEYSISYMKFDRN